MAIAVLTVVGTGKKLKQSEYKIDDLIPDKFYSVHFIEGVDDMLISVPYDTQADAQALPNDASINRSWQFV